MAEDEVEPCITILTEVDLTRKSRCRGAQLFDGHIVWIDVGMTQKGITVAKPLRLTLQLQNWCHQHLHLVHQAVMIITGAIPLQHRKLRVVAPSRLTLTIHLADLVDRPAADSEQPPSGMRATDGQGIQWRIGLESMPAAEERIRLVAHAAGSSYFGEASTTFLQPVDNPAR